MEREINRKIKNTLGAILITLIFCISSAWALPKDGTVVSGSSTITSPDGKTTTVKQTTGKSIINWKDYSIGKGETVRYIQPGKSSVSLNRVTGSDPSAIYGSLLANGSVWVINPNGLLIGKDAKINTGSFLGSTLDINNDDFITGKYLFRKTSDKTSSITNQGEINAAEGGYVVMISPSIVNEGKITADKGKAYLAAGDEVTLNFADNNLIGFTIDKQTAENALGITNTGSIIANGGEVILSAKAAGNISRTVINNEGLIQAQTIEDKNGTIKLLGGMENNIIKINGTLDASAPNGGNGGFIETSAANVKVNDSAVITTYAPYGKTGTWLIDPNDYIIAASGGDITGSALGTSLGGSNVTILSDNGTVVTTSGNGDIFVNDGVTWISGNTLTLNAQRNIWVNAPITATGSLVLRSDYSGAGNGRVYFGDAVLVNLTGGTADIYYNPDIYSAPINYSNNFTGVTPTAWMLVNNVDQLQAMNTNLAGTYALGSDIDASATATWYSGAGFAPVGNFTTPFTGAFDGLCHTISNLYINRPAQDYVGLFGETASVIIRNVGLVGGSVSGNNYVGGLVGSNNIGSIISNAYATGSVTGNNDVGGLVGLNNGGTISNSYATGSVTGISNSLVGGIGGLVGFNSGTISNSYATGNVTGSDYVGGLVGDNLGSISNAYATGSVTGSDHVGGLVGDKLLVGTISNSFWDTVTTGKATSAGGTGKTTAEMMTKTTFTGWDFTNTWWMPDAAQNTRPFLRMEWSTNITNAHQLQLMAMNLGASYTLGKDLDLATELANPSSMWGTQSETVPTTIDTGFYPVGNSSAYFTGQFDGLNHTISNLYINRSSQDWVGLFGATGSGSTIRNVGLLGGSVTGHDNVGGLVGWNYSASIGNSYATGSVTGSWVVGGLVGYNGGSITNAYATGSVTGTDYYAGGLVGVNTGTISNAYATGSVTGRNYVGGLVGMNDTAGTISNAYATGSVSGSNSIGGLVGGNGAYIGNAYATGSVIGTDYFVGGLVGTNGGDISSAYATGSVSGGFEVGGLVGWNICSISNAYATGSVNGGFEVGGLAGLNYGSISNSFWDTVTSRTTIGLGAGVSTDVTGKTTDVMQTMLIFSNAGWSITNAGGSTTAIWRIYEGYTYPLLRSFLIPVTATVTGTTTKVYDATTTVSGGTLSYAWNDPVPADMTKIKGSPFYNVADKNVGNGKPVTSGGLYSVQDGYDIIVLSSATADITKADLNVTGLGAQNKTYDGNTTATLTGTAAISPFVGDAVTLGGTATGVFEDKNAGNNKNVIVSGNTISGDDAGNYNLVQQTGLTANITQTPLTITANDYAKTYDGLGYTGGNGVTYSGLVNGETTSVLGGTLTYSGNSQGAVNAGSYIIIPGGLTSGNYTISYVNGSLMINKAPLTIIANDYTKIYDGVAYTGGNGVTYSGFIPGDTTAALGGTLTYSGTSQGAINACSYSIIPGGLTSGNYTIQYVNGTLLINKAPLTITANDYTKIYDGVAYYGNNGATYSGFVNGETPSVLWGTLYYSGDSQGATNAGSYNITPYGQTAMNYNISYVDGNLIIFSPFTGIGQIIDFLNNGGSDDLNNLLTGSGAGGAVFTPEGSYWTIDYRGFGYQCYEDGPKNWKCKIIGGDA